VTTAWYIVLFKIAGIVRAGGNAIMHDLETNSSQSALTDSFFGNLIDWFLILALFGLAIAVFVYAQRSNNREVYIAG